MDGNGGISSGLTSQERPDLDLAVQHWYPLRSSQLNDEDLEGMSGYGMIAKIEEIGDKTIRVFIEDDPFISPADKEYVINGFGEKWTQRLAWESPEAQAKKFPQTKPRYIFASSGAAIELKDAAGNLSFVAKYRNTPSQNYDGMWNLTIGSASYCRNHESSPRFAEHLGLVSTTMRRVLYGMAIVDKFAQLIVPSQYVGSMTQEQKDQYLKEIQAAIKKLGGAVIPNIIREVPSEFVGLDAENDIIISFRGKEYKRRGILVFGDKKQDCNILRRLRYNVNKSSPYDLTIYDLMTSRKTGMSFDQPMGLFRLNGSGPLMINNKPCAITACQSGKRMDADAIPLSRGFVPSVHQTFKY